MGKRKRGITSTTSENQDPNVISSKRFKPGEGDDRAATGNVNQEKGLLDIINSSFHSVQKIQKLDIERCIEEGEILMKMIIKGDDDDDQDRMNDTKRLNEILKDCKLYEGTSKDVSRFFHQENNLMNLLYGNESLDEDQFKQNLNMVRESFGKMMGKIEVLLNKRLANQKRLKPEEGSLNKPVGKDLFVKMETEDLFRRTRSGQLRRSNRNYRKRLSSSYTTLDSLPEDIWIEICRRIQLTFHFMKCYPYCLSKKLCRVFSSSCYTKQKFLIFNFMYQIPIQPSKQELPIPLHPSHHCLSTCNNCTLDFFSYEVQRSYYVADMNHGLVLLSNPSQSRYLIINPFTQNYVILPAPPIEDASLYLNALFCKKTSSTSTETRYKVVRVTAGNEMSSFICHIFESSVGRWSTQNVKTPGKVSIQLRSRISPLKIVMDKHGTLYWMIKGKQMVAYDHSLGLCGIFNLPGKDEEAEKETDYLDASEEKIFYLVIKTVKKSILIWLLDVGTRTWVLHHKVPLKIVNFSRLRFCGFQPTNMDMLVFQSAYYVVLYSPVSGSLELIEPMRCTTFPEKELHYSWVRRPSALYYYPVTLPSPTWVTPPLHFL